MRKLLVFSCSIFLGLLLLFGFLLHLIGSVTINLKPVVEPVQPQISLAAKSLSLNLQQTNNISYALTDSLQLSNFSLNRDTGLGRQKLIISSIRLNAASGKPFFDIKIGQKTSIFDLLLPAQQKFLQVGVNSTVNSSLPNLLQVKLILLIAGGSSFSIFILGVLTKKLSIRPHISLVPEAPVYSLPRLFIYCSLVFMASKLIFATEYWWLTLRGGYSGGFLANMCHADCAYYQSIYQQGYTQLISAGQQANWAFFPLFPLIMKGLLSFGLPEVSGIFFNQLLLFFSLLLLFAYTQEQFNLQSAKLATLFLALSSENIYFMTLYSEASYLFLSLAAVYSLSRQRYLLASISAGFLSATRFIGFTLALLVFFRSWLGKSLGYALFLGVIGISGLVFFMLHLHYQVHDSLAFYHIQNAWRHTAEYSWLHNPLWSAYMTLVRSNGVDKLLFLLSFPVIWNFWKLKSLNEVWLLGMLMLITFSSKSLGSYTRFVFACYPLYIYLGLYAASRYARLGVLLGVFISVHFLYLLLWLQQSGSAW